MTFPIETIHARAHKELPKEQLKFPVIINHNLKKGETLTHFLSQVQNGMGMARDERVCKYHQKIP